MRPIDADECEKYFYDHMTDAAMAGAMNAIDEMPTIDPVKHGRWVGTEFDGYADGYPVFYEWACSNCGCVFEDDEPTYNYCPNCGARMDADDWEEPKINPCLGCEDYDGRGGCRSHGACVAERSEE